jgi:hypothetical protein
MPCGDMIAQVSVSCAGHFRFQRSTPWALSDDIKSVKLPPAKTFRLSGIKNNSGRRWSGIAPAAAAAVFLYFRSGHAVKAL